MKNLLAIETSTNQASYSLTNGKDLVSYTRQDTKEHAANILTDINKLFEELDMSLDNLDAIVFGLGPGSFTGIRIACTVAKGLAFTRQLPLLGVCGLQAMLDHVNTYPALALLDARMNQVYWLFQENHLYQTKNNIPRVNLVDEILLPDVKNFVIIHYNCADYIKNMPYNVYEKVLTADALAPNASMLIRSVTLGNYKAYNAMSAQPMYIRDNIVQKS